MLHVLAKPAFQNRSLNPYNARIYEGVQALGVEVTEFHPLTAPWKRPDVFHVHWPESSFNHDLVGALATTESLLWTVRRLRQRGAKVVWTVHNLFAHEKKYVELEERFWNRFLPEVDALVGLSQSSLEATTARRPIVDGKPAFVIPHPHYRSEYPDTMDRATAREKLQIPREAKVILSFGQVKTYKNLPALVSACRDMEVYLVVAGKPISQRLASEIRAAAGESPNIQLHFRYIPSEEAQIFFRACDLVALPYKAILNSGSCLLALSFDRPVWLPEGELGKEMELRLPPGWVHTGELDESTLSSCIDNVQSLPERTEGGHLAYFSPDRIALDHVGMYRKITS